MHPVWSGVVQQVLLILLQLFIVGLLAWLHTLMPVLQNWAKHHLSAQQRQLLMQLGKEAVVFSETAYGSLNGAQKLGYAMDYVARVLGATKVQVSPQEIRAAIEMALLESKKQSDLPG
ncbi:hypothetical protein D2Q93_12260 [Alicyclobacillaceae bacterium I2511]|nr:hypothetical protein D2Q93_12260 [Alicyclobacillaceae bacterium I2511]